MWESPRDRERMNEGGGEGDSGSPVGTALLPALSNSSGGKLEELQGKEEATNFPTPRTAVRSESTTMGKFISCLV